MWGTYTYFYYIRAHVLYSVASTLFYFTTRLVVTNYGLLITMYLGWMWYTFFASEAYPIPYMWWYQRKNIQRNFSFIKKSLEKEISLLIKYSHIKLIKNYSCLCISQLLKVTVSFGWSLLLNFFCLLGFASIPTCSQVNLDAPWG
jgi:hypothetical protein